MTNNTHSSALDTARQQLVARLLANTANRMQLADQVRPVSFAQERLWLLEQLEPGSPIYNMSYSARISGPLDVAALGRSIDAAVRRHDVFRTSFRAVDGVPWQVVVPATNFDLPVTDISARPQAERDAEAYRLAAEDAERPFDLAAGPLFRARLLRLGEEEHVLLLAMHHIISDAWSFGVLLREIGTFYDSARAGEPSPLPPLAMQYSDFAEWQRQRLSGERLERELAYWTAHLAGAPPLLELPTDVPRQAVQQHAGALLTRRLPGDLVRQLEILAQREGCTLFMVMLAAFKVLLARHSGRSDIVVGSPIAGRLHQEFEELVGFFANTLAMRTDLSGDPTFRDLLHRVRLVTLDAFDHQELPFERLVEAMAQQRSLSYEPLVQVMFAFQNMPQPVLRLRGCDATMLPPHGASSRFDLTLFMWADGHDLVVVWEYATGLFEPGTVERMQNRLERLLEAVADDPLQTVSQLPLLTNEEQNLVLFDAWNTTGREAPEPDRCVHELVEDQARRTPDAVAVSYGGSMLTYLELDVRANRLAHHLCALGVGPDTLVGICVERSLDMAVALLGVLKAGGAVVALDLTYPLDRLQHVISDARLVALLTHSGVIDRLPEGGPPRVLLDLEANTIAAYSDTRPVSKTTPANLMYGIYTSGSTGLPKGVVVPHRSFMNLIRWQVLDSALAGPAKTAQFATFGFCVSFQEAFSSWCTGGTLVILPETHRRDVRALLALLEEERIERLFLPFAALKLLAEFSSGQGSLPSSLRDIIVAGERLQITREMRCMMGGCTERRLHNHYGSSETHVVSALTLSGPSESWPAVPSVGRPIANARLYALDSHLNPVPIGVTGELYVGGDCLPRGYVRSPMQTAIKLIPDPFSGELGARIYRTGDLVRFHADGEMEVLGRTDSQVKIRGFRVELGEVEAMARLSPQVRDIAVIAAPSSEGGRRLVAYVVLNQDDSEGIAMLRRFLRSKLPEHATPTEFVLLGSMPVDSNGKLDYAALPKPSRVLDAAGAATVPPRTPTEALVARIWSEILDRPVSSIHDDFFDIGGHSLLATRVATRLQDATGAVVTLRTVFNAPTVVDLAAAIDNGATSAADDEVPLLSWGNKPHSTSK